MNKIIIIFVAAFALLMTSCLTTEKRQTMSHMKDGPFESKISDTISRMSRKLPELTDKKARKGLFGKQKAIHVRRDFQKYGSKRTALKDIESEEQEILGTCCSDSKLRAYIDHGVAIHFDYYAKNGLQVDSTVVDQNACLQNKFSGAYGKVKKRDGVYLVYSSGIVKNTEKNLEWFPGPDRNVSWYKADCWVKSLPANGFSPCAPAKSNKIAATSPVLEAIKRMLYGQERFLVL